MHTHTHTCTVLRRYSWIFASTSFALSHSYLHKTARCQRAQCCTLPAALGADERPRWWVCCVLHFFFFFTSVAVLSSSTPTSSPLDSSLLFFPIPSLFLQSSWKSWENEENECISFCLWHLSDPTGLKMPFSVSPRGGLQTLFPAHLEPNHPFMVVHASFDGPCGFTQYILNWTPARVAS